MAKNKTTPDVPANDNGTANAPAATENDDGVKPAPYNAAWINVNAVAKIAGVTTQTVRNAYRDHAAFNPTIDGIARPAWFTTKMVDAFGNVTDYDVVYIDRAAVDAWIAARAAKGTGTGTPHAGAKRRIIRLTDDQIAANPTITLVDGTVITVEAPPMGRRKGKSDEAATATVEPAANSNGVDVTTADAGAGLFDVELTEA